MKLSLFEFIPSSISEILKTEYGTTLYLGNVSCLHQTIYDLKIDVIN